MSAVLSTGQATESPPSGPSASLRKESSGIYHAIVARRNDRYHQGGKSMPADPAALAVIAALPARSIGGEQ